LASSCDGANVELRDDTVAMPPDSAAVIELDATG